MLSARTRTWPGPFQCLPQPGRAGRRLATSEAGVHTRPQAGERRAGLAEFSGQGVHAHLSIKNTGILTSIPLTWPGLGWQAPASSEVGDSQHQASPFLPLEREGRHPDRTTEPALCALWRPLVVHENYSSHHRGPARENLPALLPPSQPHVAGGGSGGQTDLHVPTKHLCFPHQGRPGATARLGRSYLAGPAQTWPPGALEGNPQCWGQRELAGDGGNAEETRVRV